MRSAPTISEHPEGPADLIAAFGGSYSDLAGKKKRDLSGPRFFYSQDLISSSHQ